MNQDDVEERLRHFESLCAEQGWPLTVQRVDILRAVLERDDHPTAEQVYEGVKARIPGLSRTTVYRVLQKLVDWGLIRQLHHPGASVRFDGRIQRHHHLVCRLCGCIIDFESSGLDGLRLPPRVGQGFQIEDYSVHFTGLCAQCKKKPRDGSIGK